MKLYGGFFTASHSSQLSSYHPGKTVEFRRNDEEKQEKKERFGVFLRLKRRNQCKKAMPCVNRKYRPQRNIVQHNNNFLMC